MNPMIDLNLQKLTFPPAESPVLHDVELSVAPGEFVVVVGKPASGKSMLLHTLTGAATKFYDGILDGAVTLCGKDLADIALSEVCDFVGCMFQEPQNQIVSVTVENEVAFGISNMGIPREEIGLRVRKSLAYVGLEGMEKRKTCTLSGGQAQRLVLAGILAMEPPILILDQPGAELDLPGKCELYHHLRHLNREQGITVVMVPDNGIDFSQYADRVIIMEQGTITKDLSAACFQRKKMNRNILPIEPKETILLSVKDVSFIYRNGGLGCEHISFDVFQGDFLAVMGKNGSGKTTLLKLIEGLLWAEKGEIWVFGKPMNKKNAVTLRKNIGFLFQNPDFQIFADTVKDEVAFGLRYRSFSEEEKDLRVLEMLELVGLEEQAHIHPQKLSRSQRQKLAFASALVHRPKLLIADEPTSGLSEEDSHELMALLHDYCVGGGTVILVSHDPELVKTYANTIVVLDQQRMVGRFPRHQFQNIPQKILFGEVTANEMD